MTTRRFFSCLALALGVILVFNILIALRVDSVPKLVMREMRATPRIDILLLGSSIVEYGFDKHAFASAWPAPNPVPPFFDAAMSASSPVEHYLLGRDAYLHHEHIHCLVYGFYDQNLTDPPDYSWTKLTGNKAMGYSPEFATLAASLYAPGSVWQKWRFNLIGLIPMLREHSQLWKYIELFRRQLKQIGMPAQKLDLMGRVPNFDVYPFPNIDQFSRDCEEAAQRAEPFIPPVENMIQLARKNNSQVFIVEMPMISDHRNRLYATQAWKDYRAYLQQHCAAEGATYVNASDWVPDDANFNDNLHLNPDGAKIFSAKMAEYLFASWQGN